MVKYETSLIWDMLLDININYSKSFWMAEFSEEVRIFPFSQSGIFLF